MLVVRGPEQNLELRGANLYPWSKGQNCFAVIPIFPPVFLSGSLRRMDTGEELRWFIAPSRTMYVDNGLIVEGEQRRSCKDSRFLPALEKCLGFMDTLEQLHIAAGKLESLVQTHIYIDDEDAKALPEWLTKQQGFLEQWAEYKEAVLSLENINSYAL